MSQVTTTRNQDLELSSQDPWLASMASKKDELSVILESLDRKRMRNNLPTAPLFAMDQAMEAKDQASFQIALQTIADHFSGKHAARFLAKYVYPHIHHIQFLSTGIATAGQCDPTGITSLSFGILLIVIQSTCMFVENIEKALQELGYFEALLPYLAEDMTIFHWNSPVKSQLRKIFDDYMDFCFLILRQMIKSPVWVLLKGIFTSSFRVNLNNLKDKTKSDVELFDRSVMQAYRKQSLQNDGQILSMLKARNYTDVQFPVRSVHMVENNEFIGRKKELESMIEKLIYTKREAKVVSCTLLGIAGIGKTQTALRFLYTHITKFDAVFWVSADPEKETEILRTFCNIGVRLKLFERNLMDERQREAVFNWLETTEKRWLLVLDNVEEYKAIERYFPLISQASSAIIQTSRKSTPWATHTINIEPLQNDEGRDFFLQQMKIDTRTASPQQLEQAAAISKLLGGCPLYLSHGNGFMSLSNCGLQEYAAMLHQNSSVLVHDSHSMWRYNDGRILSTHERMLKELSAGAKSLVFMLSFMNSDNVHEELLLKSNKIPSLVFLADKVAYLGYLGELGKARLVQREHDKDNHYLRIHRATQEAMLLQLNRPENISERSASFNRVTQILRENYPSPSNLQIAEANNWPKLAKVLPHVLSMMLVFERSSPSMTGNIEFARLLSDTGGMDLYGHGKLFEAYHLNRKVLEILDSLGATDQTSLRSDALIIISGCTDWMSISQRKEGLRLRKRCLQIRKQHYSKIPPDEVTINDKIRLYNTYTDIGVSYQQINDFENVRRCCEDCLEQYKIWGTEAEYPYEYAKYYDQMAHVLLYENETQKAVDYAKHGYELIEEAQPASTMVVLFKLHYANIALQAGHQKESFLMLKELLKYSKQEYGKTSLVALEIRLNTGIVSFIMGDLEYSEKQIRKVLTLNKGETWPEENILRSKYYLSQVLELAQPQNSEWVDLRRQANEGAERVLGQKHLHKAAFHGNKNPALMFEYLVHWGCRLMTPHKGESIGSGQ